MNKILFFILISQFVFASGSSNAQECSNSFLRQYVDKKECLIDSSPSACLKFAATGYIGAAAGYMAADNYASKLYKEKLKSAEPKVQERIKQVTESLTTVAKVSDVIDDLYTKAYDKSIANASKGEFKTWDQYISKLDKLSEIKKSDPKGYEKELRRITEFERLSMADWHLNYYEELKKIQDPVLKAAASKSRMSDLESVYPKEVYRLQNLEKEYKSLGSSADKQQFIAKISEELAKSPSLRAVSFLRKTDFPELYWTQTLQTQNIQASELKKAQIQDAKNASAVLKLRTLGAAAGASAAVVALAVADNADQIKLRRCGEALGLSDQDFQIMNDVIVVAGEMNTPEISGDCNSISFNHPQKIIDKYRETGRKVSPAVCKIIQNDDQRLTSLLGENTNSAKSSCRSYSDANLKMYKDSKDKQVFEYKDGSQLYRFNWSQANNWPDMRTVEIQDTNGSPNKKQKLAFEKKYLLMHPANITDAQPQKRDINSSCQKEGSAIDCKLINAAMKARINNSLSEIFCEDMKTVTNNSSPEINPPKGNK